MAERASIFSTVQIAVETVAGTNPAAGFKQLSALTLEPGVKVEIENYRASGQKFPTVAALNKEWTEAKLGGPVTYTELIYLLSSLVSYAAPTGTPGKVWAFEPGLTTASTVKTFTIEQGDATRAHSFTYGVVKDLTLKFGRDGCDIDGTMIGRALVDGATKTAGATTVAPQIVMPTQVTVKIADTQAGLAGASALTRVISTQWSMADRFGPVWALDGQTYPAATVETEPKVELKLKLQADATGMGLLTNMRAGTTKFMRIEATGALISGADYHKLTIDTACKVMDVSPFEDSDGVFAIEWTMNGFYDSTWTKTTELTLINSLATL
jgi:hypothetical protein